MHFDFLTSDKSYLAENFSSDVPLYCPYLIAYSGNPARFFLSENIHIKSNFENAIKFFRSFQYFATIASNFLEKQVRIISSNI